MVLSGHSLGPKAMSDTRDWEDLMPEAVLAGLEHHKILTGLFYDDIQPRADYEELDSMRKHVLSVGTAVFSSLDRIQGKSSRIIQKVHSEYLSAYGKMWAQHAIAVKATRARGLPRPLLMETARTGTPTGESLTRHHHHLISHLEAAKEGGI